MLATLAELLWSLRRDGFSISTAQAIEAARVIDLLGVGSRDQLRVGLGAVVAQSASERARFNAAFDLFFAADRGHPGDLFDRLRGRGFALSEIAALSDMLFAAAERSGQSGDGPALRALTGAPDELDWLLRAARIKRVTRGLTSTSMVGFFAEQVGRQIGVQRAASAIDRIGRVLEESLGVERGRALTVAVREELSAMKRRIRAELAASLERAPDGAPASVGRRALDVPFGALSSDEAREVRLAVRDLAAQLRGALRVRLRRARRGPIDPGRTARAAMKTGGVPLRLERRRRRDDRPKLIVLCDLSESVRTASRFMLEFVAATSALFDSTRSFVFVADVVETTTLFARKPADHALRELASGAVLNLGQSSHYGRVLERAERELEQKLDRRTTIVIMGDGRTNHQADGAEALRRIRDRVRDVLWICPESSASWAVGDSHMRRYADVSSSVLVARTARELCTAARRLVRGQ